MFSAIPDNNSHLIYLDHNATTPLASEVMEAIQHCLSIFGNPSSLYPAGQEAHDIIAHARGKVAKLLNVSPEEIVFTGTGSEADNMAIKGIALKYLSSPCHIITSQIEHSAILESCRYLEQLGFSVTYLPVDDNGQVDPDKVRHALRSDTQLITIMHANNETGVVQPIEEIGQIAQEAEVLFHTDAIQSIGKRVLDLAALPVDMVSLTAHKFYGPKGIGALFIRKGVTLHPLIHGGSQERSLRAGTENLLGIVGLGVASTLACGASTDTIEKQRQRSLRDRLYEGLIDLHQVRLNGKLDIMLPGTLNLSFRHIRGDALVTALGMEQIAVSTGSACHAHETRPSHVLLAMRLSDEWLNGSVRFSLGRSTTAEQIEQVLHVMEKTLYRFRKMSPFSVATVL